MRRVIRLVLDVALANILQILVTIMSASTLVALIAINASKIFPGRSDAFVTGVCIVVVAVVFLAIGLDIGRRFFQATNRNEIGEIMNRGTAIIQSFSDSPSDGALPEDWQRVNEWLESARSFVAKKHPWFLGQFNSDANLLPFNGLGKRGGFEILRDKIEFRIARLNELLSKTFP